MLAQYLVACTKLPACACREGDGARAKETCSSLDTILPALASHLPPTHWQCVQTFSTICPLILPIAFLYFVAAYLVQ